ncbi:hypothetical protein B0H11DRAFT_2236863 [Mycena galericulata]|nr:hypothetical protein B0H11DRAFT_2236863 [Mycena galericulata]
MSSPCRGACPTLNLKLEGSRPCSRLAFDQEADSAFPFTPTLSPFSALTPAAPIPAPASAAKKPRQQHTHRGDLPAYDAPRGPFPSTPRYFAACVTREVLAVQRENAGSTAPHRLHTAEIHLSRHRKARPRGQRGAFLVDHLQVREGEVMRELVRWMRVVEAMRAGVAVRHELYEDAVHIFQTYPFLDASRLHGRVSTLGRTVSTTLPTSRRAAACLLPTCARRQDRRPLERQCSSERTLIPLLFDVLLPLLIPATSSTRARTSPGTCHHLLASASTRARLRCALHTTLALPIEPGGLPPLEPAAMASPRLEQRRSVGGNGKHTDHPCRNGLSGSRRTADWLDQTNFVVANTRNISATSATSSVPSPNESAQYAQYPALPNTLACILSSSPSFSKVSQPARLGVELVKRGLSLRVTCFVHKLSEIGRPSVKTLAFMLERGAYALTTRMLRIREGDIKPRPSLAASTSASCTYLRG